jgi:hypothetical protein
MPLSASLSRLGVRKKSLLEFGMLTSIWTEEFVQPCASERTKTKFGRAAFEAFFFGPSTLLVFSL